MVNSPPAKLLVPAKTLDRIAPPSKGPGQAAANRGAETIGCREKGSKRLDRRIEKAQPLLNARNALGQLGYPRFGRPGNSGANSDDRRRHDKNEQNRSKNLGHTQPFQRAQGRLHQKIEHDREDHRQNDVSGHIDRRQNRQKEQAAEKEGLRIGRQRHIRQ